MAKWFGNIGFSTSEETEPGIWESKIITRQYYGDVLSTRWKRQSGDDTNDNINITNQISIVSDAYVTHHCSEMAFIEFMGSKWKITEVDVQYPRLILTIGGVYNG